MQKLLLFLFTCLLFTACYKDPVRNPNRITINPAYFHHIIGVHQGYELKSTYVVDSFPRLDSIPNQEIEITRYDPDAIYFKGFEHQQVLDCVSDTDSMTIFKYYLSNYVNSFMVIEVKLLHPSNDIIAFYQYANTALGSNNHNETRTFYKH